jgi:hypothetical protein
LPTRATISADTADTNLEKTTFSGQFGFICDAAAQPDTANTNEVRDSLSVIGGQGYCVTPGTKEQPEHK